MCFKRGLAIQGLTRPWGWWVSSFAYQQCCTKQRVQERERKISLDDPDGERIEESSNCSVESREKRIACIRFVYEHIIEYHYHSTGKERCSSIWVLWAKQLNWGSALRCWRSWWGGRWERWRRSWRRIGRSEVGCEEKWKGKRYLGLQKRRWLR